MTCQRATHGPTGEPGFDICMIRIVRLGVLGSTLHIARALYYKKSHRVIQYAEMLLPPILNLIDCTFEPDAPKVRGHFNVEMLVLVTIDIDLLYN